MEFRATLLSGGKTATGIRVPEEVVEGLGGGRRAAVEVTLHGYAYRTTFGTMAGHVMIPVSAAVRAEAGLTAGDEVDVVLALDTAPRVLEVPDDLVRLSVGIEAVEDLVVDLERALGKALKQGKH